MPRVIKKVEETPVIEEKVVETVVAQEKYDNRFCANCGVKLNVVASKYNELNFCSIDCYNAKIKN